MAGIQEMCASGAKGFTPAYSVWDFNATLKTTSFFTIRTGINNIFNKQYFTKRLHFILAPVYGQVMDEMFMQL